MSEPTGCRSLLMTMRDQLGHDVSHVGEISGPQHLTDAQRQVVERTDRAHWWVGFTGYGFEVFGHVPSRAQAQSQLHGLVSRYGGTAEDAAEEMSEHDERRSEGYVYGTCYSLACPGGERGDTHASKIVPISREMFEKARAAGWRR